MATPYTFWRFTLNHRGAYMSWVPTPTTTKNRIPNVLPGLDGFYMAGQWVEPGGGIPPALRSGRHLVQIICDADNKDFVASYP